MLKRNDFDNLNQIHFGKTRREYEQSVKLLECGVAKLDDSADCLLCTLMRPDSLRVDVLHTNFGRTRRRTENISQSRRFFFSAGNALTLVICECHRNDEGPHTQTQKLSESGKMAGEFSGGMGRERRRDRREEEEL